MIFKQSYNDLFVSRVAGNVLGAECLGSLEYAAAHLADSLRLIVVLGHSSCGAVTAAVDSFLGTSDYPTIAPTLALRSIVNGVIVAVRAAAKALATSVDGDVTQCEGYRQALIETSAVLNSAMTALTIERELNKLPTGGLEAVYGVYDLVSRRVRVPTGSRTEGKPEVGLARPPKNAEAFDELSDQVVRGSFVRGLLGMD